MKGLERAQHLRDVSDRFDPEYVRGVCIKVCEAENCYVHCAATEEAVWRKLFERTTFITRVPEIAKLALFQDGQQRAHSIFEPPWESCLGECYRTLHSLLTEELDSTLYMLRMLTRSMEHTDPSPPQDAVFFVYDGAELSGKWEDDCAHLDMHAKVPKTPRLIMGFGPSSSGKTYWSRNLLRVMHDRDDEFPSQMLCVDGGRQRETSMVYSTIVNVARERAMSGISNLVVAGLSFQRSIFSAGRLKKKIVYYLKNLRAANTLSLYVPLTLSGCTWWLCQREYQPFIDITRDSRWIGLMIYQHRTHLDCPYTAAFKCRGCTNSGRDRERIDGKRYSSAAHATSMTNGLREMRRSPYCRLEIHNSGGQTYMKDGRRVPTQSIVTEHPVNARFLFSGGLNIPNCIYQQHGVS